MSLKSMSTFNSIKITSNTTSNVEKKVYYISTPTQLRLRHFGTRKYVSRATLVTDVLTDAWVDINNSIYKVIASPRCFERVNSNKFALLVSADVIEEDYNYEVSLHELNFVSQV